jgi:hypothetical protein
MPPFVYSLSFWKAFSFLVAGILGLLVVFGVIPSQFGLEAAAVLTAVLAVLEFFGIKPELRARFALGLLPVIPPFFYALAFWKALSFVVAGILALLVFFHVIPAQYALEAGAVLAALLSILEFFGIHPELQIKRLL